MTDSRPSDEVDIYALRRALRDADIEFTREYPGTEIEGLRVTAGDGSYMCIGPNQVDGDGGRDNASGVDVAWYSREGDFESNDWAPTVADAIATLRRFLTNHARTEED